MKKLSVRIFVRGMYVCMCCMCMLAFPRWLAGRDFLCGGYGYYGWARVHCLLFCARGLWTVHSWTSATRHLGASCFSFSHSHMFTLSCLFYCFDLFCFVLFTDNLLIHMDFYAIISYPILYDIILCYTSHLQYQNLFSPCVSLFACRISPTPYSLPVNPPRPLFR